MKNRIAYLIVALTFVIGGCEPNEEEIKCFPQRVTSRIVQGAGATSITADYSYEEEQLDHIVWSNFQTHFYFYDEANRLSVISQKNVQTFLKTEHHLTYQGELPVRRDNYRITLDRATQENLDTLHLSYHEYVNEGGRITEEMIYNLNEESGSFEFEVRNKYEYDLSGNLTSYVSMDEVLGDTLEAYTYIYDTGRNIYSSLNLMFDGETHVNNIRQKTDLLTGEVYDYTLSYTATMFPEQISVEVGSYRIEIINISYSCK